MKGVKNNPQKNYNQSSTSIKDKKISGSYNPSQTKYKTSDTFYTLYNLDTPNLNRDSSKSLPTKNKVTDIKIVNWLNGTLKTSSYALQLIHTKFYFTKEDRCPFLLPPVNWIFTSIALHGYPEHIYN